MKAARFSGTGWLMVVLGLLAACSGKVQSLGENGAANGGTTTTGNNGSGGTSTGGTGAPVVAGSTGVAATSYPGYPSLGGPIDKSCTCSNPNLVCDTSDQCVPRCNADNFCAKWLMDRAVRSMYHDGTALYLATAQSKDALGNWGPLDGALYRLTSPTSTPTLVATGLTDPQSILGRYRSSTYVATLTRTESGAAFELLEVTDNGVVTKLGEPLSNSWSMQGRWLAWNGSADAGSSDVMALNLETGRTPITLASYPEGTPILSISIVGDRVFYMNGFSESCTALLTTPPAPANCANYAAFPECIGSVLAADASLIYFGGSSCAYVAAYDTSGDAKRVLYNYQNVDSLLATLLANGWLYSTVYVGSGTMATLQRYPTTVGRLPQDVLPLGWGTTVFAVGGKDIYWAYQRDGVVDSRYVFYSPLPPQPCDSGLPCADTMQVCTNGFCAGQ